MTEVEGGVVVEVALLVFGLGEVKEGMLLCKVVGDLVGDILGEVSVPVPFSPPTVLPGSLDHMGDIGATGVVGNEVWGVVVVVLVLVEVVGGDDVPAKSVDSATGVGPIKEGSGNKI